MKHIRPQRMPKIKKRAHSGSMVGITSSIRSKYVQVETFHQRISKILFISQFFGIFPLSHVLSRNVNDPRFKWFSLPTIYSAILLILNGLELSILLHTIFTEGLNFHISGTLSLFTICLLESIFFWRLARNWPKILHIWQKAEDVLSRLPYTLATYNVKLRIYKLSGLVIMSAFVEHCMLLYNSCDKSNLERLQCNLNISRWEALYRRERSHLSAWLPFHIWLLPFLEWTNLSLAYPRSFTDCFIICISSELAAQFRKLSLRIKAIHKKSMPDFFWTEIREHFLILKRLVQIINHELSVLILLAFSNNMYFICFQLFNSFQNIGVDFVAVLAFWYSLIFAILRTILTIYAASTIHDYTQQILMSLRDVPHSAWNLEVQRLSQQLAMDMTAMSASGFFYLTRNFILAMASTIVTYELMFAGVINKGNIKQITNYCSNYEIAESDDFISVSITNST